MANEKPKPLATKKPVVLESRSGFVLIDQIKKGPLAGPEPDGGFSTAVNETKENGGDARLHSTDPAPSSQVNWV